MLVWIVVGNHIWIKEKMTYLDYFQPPKIATLLVITVLLSACAPSPTRAPKTSAINREMIRALSELNDLKEELKLLRNLVEELQFQQQNASQEQFHDIDQRLLTIERIEQQRGSAIKPRPRSDAIPAPRAAGVVAPNDNVAINPDLPNQGDSNQLTGQDRDQANTAVIKQPSSVSLIEQNAYDGAFEMLKQSRYQDAIGQFQALIDTWPNSLLAADAMYWMSEANYVNRQFEAALNGFKTLVQNYPDSLRLPEAMLKVGYIQYDIGIYEQAAQTFQDILERFPGHQVTVAATTRLRRIQNTIQ